MKKRFSLAAFCSSTSLEMRNLSLSASLVLLMCGNVTKAQQFGMPSKGQFLETGYGTASNEKAFDLAIAANGLVMAGYVDSSETGRFLSVWQTDSLGHLLWHYKQTNTATTYARAVTVSPTDQSITAVGAIAPNFTWNEILRDEDQLFVANVSADGNNNWTYTHTSTDTSTAAVDVLPTPTGYAVLANFLPDNSTYSQPYIVFLTDSGTLQGILPLGRNDKTLLAFKMQLNPTDSSLVVAANEYLTSGKVIPTLYTINKTGTTYKSFSYSADDYCEIHSLAQDLYGNWWLAGESYSSGDTLATVIKTNYACAKQAAYTYSYSRYNSFNDIIVDSTQLICIGTTNIYLNPDSIDGQGEGGYDVLVHYISFSGDSLLMQTLGGEGLDEGHSIIKVPNEDIAFGVGYNKSYGVEESGNAYKIGLILKYFNVGCNGVPRVLYVDNLITERDGNNNLIFDILGNSTLEDQLIFWAKDNYITYFAIYKLGFLFDGNTNVNDSIYGIQKLENFIAKCTKQHIRCGYVADNSVTAFNNVVNYNIDILNYKWYDDQKFTFNILEHEFWNANDLSAQEPFRLENGITSSAYVSNGGTSNEYFNLAYSEHKIFLTNLVNWKAHSANIQNTFDYVDRFYDIVVGNPQNAFNDTLRRQKTYEINYIADAVFTPYYQILAEDSGTYFLDPWDPNVNDLGHFRRRLEDFGNGNRYNYMIPIFSGEIIDSVNHIYCGAYNFLGQFLDGPPDTTSYSRGNHFHKVESIFQAQYDSIYYNQQTYFPFIDYNIIPAFAWFKSSCLWEKTDFSNKSLVACEDFNSMSIPRTTGIEEVSKTPTITVFPNPNEGKFTIRSSIEAESIKIYSLTGVEIYSKYLVKGTEVSLNLNLSKGLYILVWQDNSGNLVTTKFSVL